LALTAFGPEIGFLTSEGYPVSYPKYANNISPANPIPEGWSMNIYFQDFDWNIVDIACKERSCDKLHLSHSTALCDGVRRAVGLYLL